MKDSNKSDVSGMTTAEKKAYLIEYLTIHNCSITKALKETGVCEKKISKCEDDTRRLFAELMEQKGEEVIIDVEPDE